MQFQLPAPPSPPPPPPPPPPSPPSPPPLIQSVQCSSAQTGTPCDNALFDDGSTWVSKGAPAWIDITLLSTATVAGVGFRSRSATSCDYPTSIQVSFEEAGGTPICAPQTLTGYTTGAVYKEWIISPPCYMVHTVRISLPQAGKASTQWSWCNYGAQYVSVIVLPPSPPAPPVPPAPPAPPPSPPSPPSPPPCDDLLTSGGFEWASSTGFTCNDYVSRNSCTGAPDYTYGCARIAPRPYRASACPC